MASYLTQIGTNFLLYVFTYKKANKNEILNFFFNDSQEKSDLPLKDLPQRGVLDPLDAVNLTLRHSGPKQHLNHIMVRRFGEKYELKDKSKVQINKVINQAYKYIFSIH